MSELELLKCTDSKIEAMQKINNVIKNGTGHGGFNLFDTILKDHILTYEESKGLALQGTYVYKEAIAGSRYGYPDFYAKCLEEKLASTLETNYLNSNIVTTGVIKNKKGVISGFSTTDYATLPNTFAPDGDWEIVFKFNTTKASERQDIFVQNRTYPSGIDIYNSKLRLKLSNNGTSYNVGEITGTTVLQNETDYYVKASYSNSEYNLYLSLDGKYYTLEATKSSTTSFTNTNDFNLGVVVASGVQGYPLQGSIDLNESYIKINGATWWNGISTYEVYKNTNGHYFYNISEKDNIDTLYSLCGMAWFYGVDEENERIFLPRNAWYEQLTGDINEVGKPIEAGMPNVAGSAGTYMAGEITGPFYASGGSAGSSREDSGGADTKIAFDASRCSSIYGNSDTVQTNAIKKLLYICVGNTETQSSITEVVDVTTTENDTTPLLTGLYFDFKPNNLSWLKGGQQQNNEGIYKTCYNELVNVLNGDSKYGELKVIDEADMVSGVDYSEYWKVNQEKMYFITPSVAGLVSQLQDKARILVDKKEPTDEDPNWYNLYSDGWYEEGGIVNISYSQSTTTIHLSRNFNKPNYDIDLSIGGFAISGVVQASWQNKTTSSFEIYGDYSHNTATADTNWSVSGYTEAPSVEEYTENISLYFKVANAVQNLELLDVGEVMETLSNKVDVNSKVIDGQWQSKSALLTTDTAKGTTTIDLSEYLPNDNYTYDVQLIFNGSCADVSIIHLYSDLLVPHDLNSVGLRMSTNSRQASSYVRVPVDVRRKLYFYKSVAMTTSDLYGVLALGYRRIGTNI